MITQNFFPVLYKLFTDTLTCKKINLNNHFPFFFSFQIYLVDNDNRISVSFVLYSFSRLDQLLCAQQSK